MVAIGVSHSIRCMSQGITLDHYRRKPHLQLVIPGEMTDLFSPAINHHEVSLWLPEDYIDTSPFLEFFDQLLAQFGHKQPKLLR